MKRLIAVTSGLVASLTVPIIAFATQIDPCSSGTTLNASQFNALCNLSSDSLGKVIQLIIVTLFILAVVIALFFLILGGIKWITSGGAKEKIESARSTIIAAIIGLILVFLAFFILQVLLGVFGLSFNKLELPKLM